MPSHPDEIEVLTISTEMRVLGLTASDFDDERKSEFAASVADCLEGVESADVSNVVATDASDDGNENDGGGGGSSRLLTASGVDVSFDISVEVGTFTNTVVDDTDDDLSAVAFASLVDELESAVNQGELVASLSDVWGGGVSLDTSIYEPPTTYTVVAYAAPSAAPSAFADSEAAHVDAAAVFISSPIGLGVMGGVLAFLACCCYLCRPESEHERQREAEKKQVRARNATRAWDEEHDDPWDGDLPTSPLHGATNDHGRRLEPVGDATPHTPAGSFFSSWHINNFIGRSRSRSPSSTRSWRSPASSVRGRRSPGGHFLSWFIGGDGVNDQTNEIEMKAQTTPLAQDQGGDEASIWCEREEDEDLEPETGAEKRAEKTADGPWNTEYGRRRRAASQRKAGPAPGAWATASASEVDLEGELEFEEDEDEDENEFAPLSPRSRPSRRDVTGKRGRGSRGVALNP